MGESGVGKTNIFTWFSQNEFNENSMATIGMDFASLEKIIDNQNVKI